MKNIMATWKVNVAETKERDCGGGSTPSCALRIFVGPDGSDPPSEFLSLSFVLWSCRSCAYVVDPFFEVHYMQINAFILFQSHPVA